MNRDRFLSTLRELMKHSRSLQNDPIHGVVPQEDLACEVVLSRLTPLSTSNGGPLIIERITFVPGRSNLIVTYPSASAVAPPGAVRPCVSFAGVHFDVVPADPSRWSVDPFSLTVQEGGRLIGRGVSDCLGHVALLCEFLADLATRRVPLRQDVIGVFISDEEVGTCKVGVELLQEKGFLARLRGGPCYWLDCTDKMPTIGSGGLAPFELIASGKSFHSGFPQRAVNALELANDAMLWLQKRFYARFVPHPLEKQYGYQNSSSIKPTLCRMEEITSLNIIPAKCTLVGEARLTPFYPVREVMAIVESWISELSGDGIKVLEQGQRGPDAKYSNGGSVALKWLGTPISGLACDISSPGFKVLSQATTEVVGKCVPLADTGALPLVADLKESGIDIQTFGFAVEEALHAVDEWAILEDFAQGWAVIARIIELLQK